MSFILDPDIHTADYEEVMARFARYHEYLESISEKLPPGARRYALGPHHNCGDRECPHDSWLEDLTIHVKSSGKRSQIRRDQIHLRLLGSHHDGYVEFYYKNVYNYSLVPVAEWMYDEIRLSDEGTVIHEIRFDYDGMWRIECKDVIYKWIPFTKNAAASQKILTPEEKQEIERQQQIEKNQAAIRFLDSLRAEEKTQEQKETWEFLRKALDEDRLSYRKLFPQDE